jgi:hypothetical protein
VPGKREKKGKKMARRSSPRGLDPLQTLASVGRNHQSIASNTDALNNLPESGSCASHFMR